MNYAVILAGGSGSRMGPQDMPKQFLMLGSKPIFIHTVEQFIINKKINKIILCCPSVWLDHTKNTIQKYLPEVSNIFVVEGGETRQDTILKGCKFIQQEFGIGDNDVIITHDAVRPFITQRIIDDNIEKLKMYNAVDTVIPSTDTIVVSNDKKIIDNIPLRDKMYQGQTPQSFNLKKFMTIFESLTDEEKTILTDACKAFVLKNEEVALVKGETYNIKITTIQDLKISNAILMERERE